MWYFSVRSLFSLSLYRMVASQGMVMVLRVRLTQYMSHLRDWVWNELLRWVRLTDDNGLTMCLKFEKMFGVLTRMIYILSTVETSSDGICVNCVCMFHTTDNFQHVLKPVLLPVILWCLVSGFCENVVAQLMSFCTNCMSLCCMLPRYSDVDMHLFVLCY